jgi:hypothetical protein
MIDAIGDALKETPWWVYVLFIYLVKRGLTVRRPAVQPFARLIIVPALFTVWGLYELIERFQPRAGLILVWALTLLAGGALGYALLHRITVRADHQNRLIARPGDPTFLPLVILIFAVKYAFSFALGAHPGLAESHVFAMSDVGASGLITGVFLGKLAAYGLKFYQAPSQTLTPSASS